MRDKHFSLHGLLAVQLDDDADPEIVARELAAAIEAALTSRGARIVSEIRLDRQ